MRKIEILDCTLRDGGYVNNWRFGRNAIIKIIQQLTNAGVEIVECGFWRTVIMMRIVHFLITWIRLRRSFQGIEKELSL